MSSAQIDKLLELISEIVNISDIPYKEKAERILGSCSEDEKTALLEFVSWFDDEEE